jgi:hypothetical protein
MFEHCIVNTERKYYSPITTFREATGDFGFPAMRNICARLPPNAKVIVGNIMTELLSRYTDSSCPAKATRITGTIDEGITYKANSQALFLLNKPVVHPHMWNTSGSRAAAGVNTDLTQSEFL